MVRPGMDKPGDGQKTQPYGTDPTAHNRGSRKPIPGKCGAKLRKSKPARFCKKEPVAGRKRCELHGGTVRQGLDHPNTKTGLRSRYLPKGLLERYETARADSDLMKIREDVALTEGLLALNTARLKHGQPLTVRQEARIVALMDNRRKLIEAEARRLKDLHQMITIDRYLGQMTVVGNLVLKHFGDLAERIEGFHADLKRHLLAPAKEGDDEG